MFELWPLSLFMFIVAFVIYIILKDAKEKGSMFVGILYPRISKKTHPEFYNFWVSFRWIGIFICIIFGLFLLSVTVPDSEKTSHDLTPRYTSAEFEEILIGTWEGDSPLVEGKLSITFSDNGTCRGIYDGINHRGTWIDGGADGMGFNEVNFNWDETLKVPSLFEGQYHKVLSASYQYGSLHTSSGFSLDKK